MQEKQKLLTSPTSVTFTQFSIAHVWWAFASECSWEHTKTE